MATLRKRLNGLSTRVYKFFLSLYFSTKQGKDFSETYGLSFDPDFILSQLPTVLPSKEDYYTTAKDLGEFEILDIDEEKLEITLREICTDNVITLHIDLFDILFVKIEKPNLDEVIQKAKK